MGWWRRLRGDARREPAFEGEPQLAGRIDLPGGVSVHPRQVPTSTGPKPCWTFATHGLSEHGQKELAISYVPGARERLTDVADHVLGYVETVRSLARQGRYVDVGGVSLFRRPALFGSMVVLYLAPRPMVEVEMPTPSLTVVPLFGEEASALQQFGLPRVIGRLGRHFREFPCPAWCVANREVIAACAGDEASFLARVPHAYLPRLYARADGGPAATDRRVLRMRAHPAARDDLRALLAAAPAEGTFAFVPGIDPQADSLLTWLPGQRTRAAIAPEGSGGQRMGLCFVLVSIPAPRDEWHEMEDGAAVLLTAGSWERFRRALEDGASIDLPMDVGASLSFAWIRDAYVSPIDGRVFGEGGDGATSLRDEPAPLEGVPEGERAGSLGRCSADVIVLSPGELLTSRVDVEDLAAYLKRVEAALRLDRDDEALAGLSLRIELAPAQRVTIRAGGPGVEDVEAVRATVGRITPVPDVKAEVLVELAFRAASA